MIYLEQFTTKSNKKMIKKLKKKFIKVYVSRQNNPMFLFILWGSGFFVVFLCFAFICVYFLQLHINGLNNELTIAYDSLSNTLSTLDVSKKNLSSLYTAFDNNNLSSTTEALQNVQKAASPTCKQFLSGKKDLFYAYIKSGGIHLFEKKK